MKAVESEYLRKSGDKLERVYHYNDGTEESTQIPQVLFDRLVKKGVFVRGEMT